MILGLIDLGGTFAVNTFVGVGVIALQVAYAIPTGLSLIGDRRVQVNRRDGERLEIL